MISGTTHALTVQEFMDFCGDDGGLKPDVFGCVMYLEGYTDGLGDGVFVSEALLVSQDLLKDPETLPRFLSVMRPYCIPKKATRQQIFQVVFNYFQRHPEIWHKSTRLTVRDALAEVWPRNGGLCP